VAWPQPLPGFARSGAPEPLRIEGLRSKALGAQSWGPHVVWIELHGDIFWHQKTIAAAQMITNGDIYRLVGHLCRLWTWALDYAEDGDLSYLQERDIAEAAGWRGKPGPFVKALRVVHFIDPDGKLHNWSEYSGRLVERRRRDRARKREERMRSASGSDEPSESEEAGRGNSAGQSVAGPNTPYPTEPDRTAPHRGT